jgi:hypothetical protein
MATGFAALAWSDTACKAVTCRSSRSVRQLTGTKDRPQPSLRRLGAPLRGLALIKGGWASSVGARIFVRRFGAVFVLLVTGIWVAQVGRFGAVTACLASEKYP